MVPPGRIGQPRRVDAAVVAFDPVTPAFVARQRGVIDPHWRQLSAANPSLFNGEVLLFRDVAICDGEVRAVAAPIGYDAFTAFLEDKIEAPGYTNVFGAAAILSADGTLLLGRMGTSTYQPGQIKLVSGTPDRSDIDPATGRIDIDGSIERELAEETGLRVADGDVAAGYGFLVVGPFTGLVRTIRYRLEAGALIEHIDAYLAAQREPELSGMVAIAGLDDPQLPAEVRPLYPLLISAR